MQTTQLSILYYFLKGKKNPLYNITPNHNIYLLKVLCSLLTKEDNIVIMQELKRHDNIQPILRHIYLACEDSKNTIGLF